MGTDQGTGTALDTDIGVPNRNLFRHGTFFVLTGSGGEGSVVGDLAHRELVPFLDRYGAEHFLYPGVFRGRKRRLHVDVSLGRIGILHLYHRAKGLIDSVEVSLNYFLTLPSVGMFNMFLHQLDRFIFGEYPGDLEVSSLHDRIYPVPHAGFPGNMGGVDYIELEFLIDDAFLGFYGKLFPYIGGAKGAIEEESPAFLCISQHIVEFHIREFMAGQEVGFSDEVWPAYGFFPKAQVGNRKTSGLFRVV